jgi:hypothetical protein
VTEAQISYLLDIQSNAGTAYHQQTYGQAERINQEMEHHLLNITRLIVPNGFPWPNLPTMIRSNSRPITRDSVSIVDNIYQKGLISVERSRLKLQKILQIGCERREKKRNRRLNELLKT